ncbi:uncharacterized protein LOC131670966 [Phymastichus coffea]|uniref:uncharacterized protein LOC131670966 n=1 Tax=Phymastichus coffea TaxID=108790 RepID=UPI00273A756F|nr:uncharacterized protein LOC131670966 [Phymastichus coffea]
MADVEEKVNMSLDDIIKMEKKKKINAKTKRGGGPGGPGGAQRGRRGRSASRVNMRGRGNMQRTRSRSRSRVRQNGNQTFSGKRGQWNRFPHNRGGQNRRFNNQNYSNLTRSRSNMSLNRMNMNNQRGNRGGFGPRRGGRFGGMTRSRSRTNLSYNKPTFLANKRGGFLKRTSSMPNLSDPSSVYNRLGYQSPAQIAYRNRVKRAKSVLLQKNKVMRMANALMLTPPRNNLSPKQPVRRNSIGSLHSDQLMRAQRRSQYEDKLYRASNARVNSAAMNFYNSMNAATYAPMRQHPAMALYPSTIQNNSIGITQRQMQRRGRSPFRKNLQPVKQEPGFQRSRSARRNRSRSRSRSRPAPSRRNSVMNLMDNDYEDRSFSEVMYSLSNNFGITGRTLNDRFSF